jgi:hypothetical protein
MLSMCNTLRVSLRCLRICNFLSILEAVISTLTKYNSIVISPESTLKVTYRGCHKGSMKLGDENIHICKSNNNNCSLNCSLLKEKSKIYLPTCQSNQIFAVIKKLKESIIKINIIFLERQKITMKYKNRNF